MANNLSFSIAVNMLTEGVKKGAETFRRELQSMQYKTLAFASALGFGGLGLGNFVSKLIETARETNRAATALKNVSGTTSDFVKNQKFLLDLSSKYGIEINSLTGSYAKFTAAANSANMPMADQQKIFSAMSRASTAFGLSAEDTNLSFLALTQMMSKGKISSEELRRQLGEKIPVAMAAMAKAAGVPINKLDKLLQQGKLMSADVLPKFADALNNLIPNVNTDNLETSINRMKNAFTSFTKGTGIQEGYKSLIDSITGIVQTASNNIRGIISTLISLISGVVLGKLYQAVAGYFTKSFALMNSYVSKAEVADAQVLLATQKRIAAEQLLEVAKSEFDTAEAGKRVSAKKALTAAELALSKASAIEQAAIIAQTTAKEEAARISSLSGWKKFGASVSAAFRSVYNSIVSTFKAFLPMIVISGITAIIQKLIEWEKKQKEIRNAWGDYQNALKDPGNNSDEYNRLVSLKKITEDITRSLPDRKSALNEINSILGTNYKINEKTLKIEGDINKKYSERLTYLQKQNDFQRLESERSSNRDKLDQALRDRQTERSHLSYLKTQQANPLPGREGKAMAASVEMDVANSQSKLKDLDTLIAVYTKIETDIYGRENKIKTNVDKIDSKKTDDNKAPSKKTPLEDAEKKYEDTLKEYKNQLSNGSITQSEHNKLIDELNKKTYNELSGMLTPQQATKNHVFQQAKTGVNNPLYTKADEATEKFTEEQAKYNNTLAVLNKKKELNILSDEDYNKSLNELIDSTIDSILSIDNIGSSADEFAKKLKAAKIPEAKDFKAPQLSTVDHFDDYKKTDTEKIQGLIETDQINMDKISEAFNNMGIDDIQQKINDTGGDLEKLRNQFSGECQEMFDQLTKLMKEVPDYTKALKILELRNYIKDLQKQVGFLGGGYKNFESVVNGLESIYNAWENVKSSFKDKTVFEGLLSFLSAITSTIDTIDSTINSIKDVTEIIKKLTAAKQLATNEDNIAANQKVANVVKGVVAEKVGAAVTKDTAKDEVAANTASAASSAGKGAAKLPFPYNLLAIGLAIGGVIALFDSIPKFANGGIVGGSSSSGDKILTRLNSGEMVLNKGQQSTIYGLLNKPGSTQTDIKVRGSDLFLTLKNYQRQTGKRL